MGNVINSCPNNKILVSSIKLNDPSKSCLNCSKIGYQLNSTSTACICSTGFYSNNNICYPISCSATGYIPNPNDNTMLQLIPLPYNNGFFFDITGTLKTINNDTGYNFKASFFSITHFIEPFNNSSILSIDFPFDSSGFPTKSSFNRNQQYKIIKKDGTQYSRFTGEFSSISLPYKIKLKKYKLTFLNNNFPKHFFILGTNLLKNDNTSFDTNNTWYILDERTFSSIPTNQTNEYYIYYNSIFNNTFSTIVIVIDRAFTTQVKLNQFHLYGTYEDNSCICAFDYYLPSDSVIKYDNGILNGCVVNPVKPYITFYDNKGNTQQFLYNKYIDNIFYFYRTTSDTCAMDPTKNNIKITPIGFKTNFTISNISSAILLTQNTGNCVFSGVSYLNTTKISDIEYKFDADLSTNYWFTTVSTSLKFLQNQISY